MGEGVGEECLVPAGGGVGEFGGPLQFCYLFPAGYAIGWELFMVGVGSKWDLRWEKFLDYVTDFVGG